MQNKQNGGINVNLDSLYDPIMYMIENGIKRWSNAQSGNIEDEGGNYQYVEPIELIRDSRMRLMQVSGWEHVDVYLNFNTKGMLETVLGVHKLTGRSIRYTLEYDDRRLLQRVIPENVDESNGDDPGKIDIPKAIEDY